MRHVLRLLLVTLALVLMGLVLAPRAVPAQGTDPCAADRFIPYQWRLRPLEPCGNDSVTVVFTSCGPCVEFLGYERPDSGSLRLDLRVQDDVCMLDVCMPDSLEVPLGRLAAGHYQLNYGVRAGVVFGDSGFCYVTRRDSIRFVVGCPEPPEPACDSLPYVGMVQIGPAAACDSCLPRICPGDSIPLHIAGCFPDGCYRFAGLELVPGPEASPLPAPPIVRIRVDRAVCSMCTMAPVPWSADTALAGLPGGDYALRLELVLTDWCRATPTDTTYCRDRRAFTVKDTCASAPATPCLFADWDHADRIGGCDAFVGAGDTARVGMRVTTQAPLAGLQGTLSLYPSGLAITALRPIGAAADMHLTWEAFPGGAKFVMFAEEGAPIVPLRCAAGERCVPDPVLEVELQPVPGAAPPSVTHLTVRDLLGADSLGTAVPECPIMTLVVVEARICAGASCDFNRDGRLDVRDLVVMVHCLLGTGACPDSALAYYDCNGDGRSGVDDVLCCARRLLRGAERDTVPGRAEPDVAVEFGDPEWRDGGLRTPIRILGAERLGAARLALSLPLDRYEVAGVALAAADPRWLALHEVVDGQLVIGLVGLESSGEEATTLELSLDLAPRSGAEAGGEIELADLQASGPDGVTLDLSVAPASVALPLPAAVALSAAQPNPFSGTTRFTLALDRGAAVDVTVHDLAGRRVATLFHGLLPAGMHEFTWSGTRSDGSAAAHGVYFVQARVNGERLTHKLVLLRGE